MTLFLLKKNTVLVPKNPTYGQHLALLYVCDSGVPILHHERTQTMHDDMTIISAGNGPMVSQERYMDQWKDRDWEMDQSDSYIPHLS